MKLKPETKINEIKIVSSWQEAYFCGNYNNKHGEF